MNRDINPVTYRDINPVHPWNTGSRIWLDSRLLNLPGEHFARSSKIARDKNQTGTNGQPTKSQWRC